MSPTITGASKDSSGVTLVETLFVLALLIVVVAISVPLLSTTTSFARLRGDAFDLAGKLTQAKFRAATELSGYQLRFDLTNNSYVIERRSGGTFSAVEPVMQLRNGVSYASSDDLSIFATVPTDGEQAVPAKQSTFIAFNSRGVPVDLAGKPLLDNAIYLRNENNEFFAVTVSLAGLVEVWKYLPDGTWTLPQ